jgi:Raf kinase inhibitor-like YbhB/YbcL family protein
MRGTFIRAALGATLVAVVMTACGGDDGDGGNDGGGANGGSDAARGAVPDAGGLVVVSPAFATGQPIPERYTCDGDEVSPPLAIQGAPTDAVELAVVVRDPDADGFVHWVVAGLPADTTGLAEGGPLPDGAVEAGNGFDEAGWAGPCPPEGDHTYELTVYALTEPSELSPDDDAEAGAEAVESADASAVATLRWTYERP